jgi:flagellar basal body P-ring formation protein FlgA
MQKKRLMATRVMRLAVVGVLALVALRCQSGVAAAETNLLLVPAMTIYPGDIITDQVLVDRDFSSDPMMSKMAGARTRANLVGKVAWRTLLPGQPILANAVGEPTVVASGGKVRILFEEGTLRITALGTALQSGGAGDIISVRNISSGLTVSGTVQADGCVHVGGS